MSAHTGTIDSTVGTALVRQARHALEQYVRHGRQVRPDLGAVADSCRAPGATFVTITRQGQLRGCIGSTEARLPLLLDVARNAVAAAARDPRFAPVRLEELDQVRLEVTVLSPPQPLVYERYADLLGRLRTGVDGVILTWGARRGVLLPQVWARLPGPDQFLEAICAKAGIPPLCLRQQPPTVGVRTFQVSHFREDGYQEPGS